MLVDTATIIVLSGRGGDGAVSFRREKYIPKGGPDGGDGGDGGSVHLVASTQVDTLLDMAGRHHWYAGHGQPGRPKQCYGAKGRDLDIPVPPGTLVYDEDTGQLIHDLDTPGTRITVAQGGRGGFGNEHFKSATNQTPRESTPGEPAQQRALRLELKLIADIGLIGVPNAGKSTLLGRVSRARPKIGDYPFTTLQPHLGIASLDRHRRMTVADIPGLIEGAHRGLGLGTEFLRHIERTGLLVHVVALDLMSQDPLAAMVEVYHVIRRELRGYSQSLADKSQIVAVNKTDLLPVGTEQQQLLAEFERAIGQPIMPISAATGRGLAELLNTCWQTLPRTGVPMKNPVAGWITPQQGPTHTADTHRTPVPQSSYE